MTLELRDPTLLRTQAFIDGKWVDADSGATLDVTNPANGECVAKVARVGVAETERAIAAAGRAFASWRMTTAKERAALLREWFNLIMAAQDESPLRLIKTLAQIRHGAFRPWRGSTHCQLMTPHTWNWLSEEAWDLRHWTDIS